MRRPLLPTTLLLLALALTACSLGTTAAPTPSPAPTAAATPAEIVFYGWDAMFPPSVLMDFQKETGITVRMVTYASSEEAIKVVAGGANYDLMIMGNEFVPQMITGGLLANIDLTQVPNFKNISPNFRGLAYDPDNRYSIPYTWGTIGLVYNARTSPGVKSWSDLWKPEYAGRVAIWGIPRHVIAITLKSLGYSANSENPAELEAAYKRLQVLKPALKSIVNDNVSMSKLFEQGDVSIGMGYAGDVLFSRAHGVDIGYVLPDEGALLWGDNYVIPSAARNKAGAEQFLNYLLRPEVSAAIVEHNFYATPNDAAKPLIDPAIRDDAVIFPPNKAMHNAEIILALSDAGQARYDALWKRLMGE